MVLVIVLFILLLVAGICYGVYRFVLIAPVGDQNEPHHVPGGPQYQPYHAQMHRLIDALVDMPSERVYITSRDGLKLAGDWYPGQPGHPRSEEHTSELQSRE